MVEPLSQFELFEPEHVTFHEARLQHSPSERIYLEHWRALNKRSPGVNHGFTYIEHILCPAGLWPGPVSRRDAAVAASVVQWLGTNCGMAFLMEAERAVNQQRIADGHALRTVWPLQYFHLHRPQKTRLIEVV